MTELMETCCSGKEEIILLSFALKTQLRPRAVDTRSTALVTRFIHPSMGE